MLIEFSAKNFMSIKDEVRLSLVARPFADRRETHLVTARGENGIRPVPLVRSAAIYGPNASGKTNIILALSAMKATVASSFQAPDDLPMIPFAFDPECHSKPSVFEVVFILNGVRYQYGFSATSEAVVDEWLFAWPRGRVQTWFERSGERYEFGQKLRGPKDTWKKATRSDALFLSTAVTLNSEQLKPISDWFLKTLHIAQVGGWSEAFTTARCRESSQTDGVSKQDILDFLNRSDLSIKGIRVDDREFKADQIPGELPPSVREEMKKNLVGKNIPEITLVHDIGNHQDFELDIRLESHGTQRIFALAGPWLDVLKRGSIIVIDELEQGLHPALVGFLIDCFHNPALNRKDAQLVFTTHNTSILSQDSFRRDQIWFCERNRAQETRLFPLTQFHPRKKYENLERSYLSGRYGALPHLRSFDETVR